MAAIGAVLCGGIAAACGVPGPHNAVSPPTLHAVAGKILDVANGNGIPIADDYIGCRPGTDDHSDTCFGLTSDEPVRRVEGTFTAAGPGDSSGCPGVLTITVGPPIGDTDVPGRVVPLSTVQMDPCR